MKKIVVFSGAGLDKESGIETFRGTKDSTWNNYDLNDVCSLAGWKKDRETVLDFYNERRRELPGVVPNEAHILLASMESSYNMVHVTQNVTDLLERANCSTIYHLHGELTKAIGSHKVTSSPIDIGYDDINIGDQCMENGSQLRPDIVWFGEMPKCVDEAYNSFMCADVVVIIGTSLNITYTLDFFNHIKRDAKIYYIDPEPSMDLDSLNIEYIKKNASDGIKELISILKD